MQTYWHFHDYRYEKTSRTCAEPHHIGTCPLPSHQLRNGAYGFALFIRGRRWRLDIGQTVAFSTSDRINTLMEPLRNVYGVSDKVLAIGFSDILLGAADVRPVWRQVGLQLIAVDTLVHNFLHRTGILRRFNAAHPYGAGCYRPGGCADIVRSVAEQIDSRQPGLSPGLSPVRAVRDLAVLQA